jgi:predicted porin
MNKKLMALAVAGALTAPGLAVAQVGSSPGITLYGRIDSMIMNNAFTENFANRAPGANPATAGSSKVTKGDMYQAGNAMGFRGREDLGGGTSFWFQLEIGVWTERLDTSTATGNNWGGRNSAVGFTSGLGDISWGIWDAPYKQIDGVWNLVTSSGLSTGGILMNNGDTTGAIPNALCASTVNNGSGAVGAVAPAVNTCTTEVTGGGTQFSRRMNDSLNYNSPVWSGLQFKLQTALATFQSPSTTANSGNIAGGQLVTPKFYSGNVTWARGPISVGGGYETHQGFRQSAAATGNPSAKDTAIQIGAKFDFGMGQVGAGVEKLKYAAIDSAPIVTGNRASGAMNVQTWVLNGRVNAGPGAVFASYSTTPGGKNCFDSNAAGTTAGTTIGSASCGNFGKAKMMTVGYDYILSKRTKLYVAYNKFDNGDGTNYYYIAGPAGNNSNGTASGISAGTDVTTVGMGVSHTF